jgi:hypothetical protein
VCLAIAHSCLKPITSPNNSWPQKCLAMWRKLRQPSIGLGLLYFWSGVGTKRKLCYVMLPHVA